MIDFINKHGGLAIGGSKFILPQKPGKPMAKDGKAVKEGEWFVDNKGNKVKMVKNVNGEEEYEIEESNILANNIFYIGCLFNQILQMIMELKEQE